MTKDIFYVCFEGAPAGTTGTIRTGKYKGWVEMESVNGCEVMSEVYVKDAAAGNGTDEGTGKGTGEGTVSTIAAARAKRSSAGTVASAALNPVKIGSLLMSAGKETSLAVLRGLRDKTTTIKKIIVHRLTQSEGGLALVEETVVVNPRVSFILNEGDSTIIEFRDFTHVTKNQFDQSENGTVVKSHEGYNLAAAKVA